MCRVFGLSITTESRPVGPGGATFYRVLLFFFHHFCVFFFRYSNCSVCDPGAEELLMAIFRFVSDWLQNILSCRCATSLSCVSAACFRLDGCAKIFHSSVDARGLHVVYNMVTFVCAQKYHTFQYFRRGAVDEVARKQLLRGWSRRRPHSSVPTGLLDMRGLRHRG